MTNYLLLLSILPLIGYLIDGYRQKNIKKGIIHILLFFGIVVISRIFLELFGLAFAMGLPVLLLLLVLLFGRKKNEKI